MLVKFKYDILEELFTLASSPAEDGANCLPEVYRALGGKVLLISYSGSIGLSCIDKFKPSLFATLTGDAQQIIISLKDVTEFSHSSIGALVDFASVVLGRGRRLYLLEPPASMEQDLKELKLTMFFVILKNQDDLVRMLPDD